MSYFKENVERHFKDEYRRFLHDEGYSEKEIEEKVLEYSNFGKQKQHKNEQDISR